MKSEDEFPVGVEIENPGEEGFPKIFETLQRIGIGNDREKTLTQTCHILHKRGRYAIVHFKEMFHLDGKVTTFSEEDANRRDKIISLLEDWGLVKPLEKYNKKSNSYVKIIKYSDKDQWNLSSKYTIGNKK